LKEPGILGQSKGDNPAPGYAFTFGFFDGKKTVEDAVKNGWLYMSDSIVNPAIIAYTSDFDARINLEPIPSLKIELSAKRYTADNTTVNYMYTGMPSTFTGSYNITSIAIATAFKPKGNASSNYNSEVFNTFLANRKIMASRLRSRLTGKNYPSTGFFTELPNIAGKPFDPTLGDYTENSSDVLIPAFLAAYTGRDINSSSTGLFPGLASILPNWRMSYDGLSRIGWIRDNFKSVSITHAYTCRYSIGNYSSYSTWVALDGEDNALGYIRDVQSNNPIPSSPYDISSVSMTEQFSPLVGVNVALKNSMTGKVEYRKQRNLALNITSLQLIEANTDEMVVGVGYVLKDFDVILRLSNNDQAKIKNDLKISADFSYKNLSTLLRKIDENITQASSGNKMYSIKIMADYVFSSKVNLQVFFDRQSTNPLISTSYPVAATNFGVNIKFMLTR
jgi:cell surface protein SprA